METTTSSSANARGSRAPTSSSSPRLDYERVRAEGARFFVVPGHEDASVELIVATTPTYLVVEKDGHAGIVAEAADPRDGDS